MGEYSMSHIEFPPSTIGRHFVCGLSGEPIEHHEVLQLIKKRVCEVCPFYNTLCIPALPERNLVNTVISIKNAAGSGYQELPSQCPLILGGVFTHDGQWRTEAQAKAAHDKLCNTIANNPNPIVTARRRISMRRHGNQFGCSL